MQKGGSYALNNDGEKELQFPVFNKELLTYEQAALFGKYAIPTAKNYVDSGFKTLSAPMTMGYDKLVEMGVKPQYAFTFVNKIKEIQPDRASDGTITRSATEKQREFLMQSIFPTEIKEWFHDNVLDGDKLKKDIDFSSEGAFNLSSALSPERMESRKKLLGVPDEVYLAAYNAQKDIKGDKDARGNTIPLSASKKKKAAIDRATPEITPRARTQLYEEFGVSKELW